MGLKFRIAFDTAERALRGRPIQGATLQHLGPAQYGGQRSAQFMRDRREKFVFQAIGILSVTVQPRVGNGLRAIELGLEQRDLGVEEVGARRHARLEPIANHPARFAGAPHRVVGCSNRRPARFELADALGDTTAQRGGEVVGFEVDDLSSDLAF